MDIKMTIDDTSIRQDASSHYTHYGMEAEGWCIAYSLSNDKQLPTLPLA
jgi:hypothetical protein